MISNKCEKMNKYWYNFKHSTNVLYHSRHQIFYTLWNLIGRIL